MQITLIGSGRAAYALGQLCRQGGHKVIQVFGRNRQTTLALAEQFAAEAVFDWQGIRQQADIYIVALPDSMVPQVPALFQIEKGIIVHTAGAVPLQALAGAGKNFGVLYPLQSLTKHQDSLPAIPLLVDGNTAENKTLLHDFALSLSPITGYATDAQRLGLHLAAVWVNNFTNHLFALAQEYCSQQGLNFGLLLPLIQHTSNRLQHTPAAQAQTGPAIRHDAATLQQHEALLQAHPDMLQLYRHLTLAIQQYHRPV
ncbi:MAG: F420-dependent NADP oxidoreductase [Chitinophagaceae bacterium]|nr:F420-dependent NADP oxidoreductase [Chitinophagaceae bacterium]